MKIGKNFQVVGVLGLRLSDDDECVAAIELDGDFELLPPDVMCPALETYIAILGNILDEYEAMYFAASQGEVSPKAQEMN